MTTQSTPTNSDTLPQGTRVGRTALRVGDLEEMTGFYRDVVGLAIHERSGSRIVLGAPEQPLLELLEDPSASPRRGTEAGLYHYALRVPRRAALGAALERIQGGWQLDGAADHGVSEALYLRDPAENGIEIYWDRPRESWPIDETGQVQMKTSPLDLDAIRAASNNGATVPVDTDLGHVHLEVLGRELDPALTFDALVDHLFEQRDPLLRNPSRIEGVVVHAPSLDLLLPVGFRVSATRRHALGSQVTDSTMSEVRSHQLRRSDSELHRRTAVDQRSESSSDSRDDSARHSPSQETVWYSIVRGPQGGAEHRLH